MSKAIKAGYIILLFAGVLWFVQLANIVTGIVSWVNEGESLPAALIEYSDQLGRLIPLDGFGDSLENWLREKYFPPKPVEPNICKYSTDVNCDGYAPTLPEGYQNF